MTIFKTISEARAGLTKLVDEVSEGSDPVTITVNGQPKAVIISPEELDSLRETLEILSTPGALEDILEGMAQIERGEGIPLEDLEKELS